MITIDELEYYLLTNFPNNFISGTENINILLWGNRINYNVTPCFYSLNIGIDYDALFIDNESLKKRINCILNTYYKSNNTFKKIYKYCQDISLKSNFPFIVIVYPTFPAYKASFWENTSTLFPLNDVKFYVHNDIENARILNGSELVTYIYSLLGTYYSDKGTTKDKNKKIHDYFQYWSRTNLSQYVKKLDFDGILANNSNTKHILIEIKRSSYPLIPNWKPYVDDANNYKIQLAFANKMHSFFWLLHHTGKSIITNNSNISFYDICGIDEQMIKKLYISQKNDGKKAYDDYLICNQQHVSLSIVGTPSLHEIINQFINS